MKCPVCNDVRMREVEKNGVMIDVCPECKGVWLDRGELEKLMNEVREFQREYEHYEEDRRYPYPDDRKYREYDDRGYYDRHHKPKKKKRVFDILEDLFD